MHNLSVKVLCFSLYLFFFLPCESRKMQEAPASTSSSSVATTTSSNTRLGQKALRVLSLPVDDSLFVSALRQLDTFFDAKRNTNAARRAVRGAVERRMLQSHKKFAQAFANIHQVEAKFFFLWIWMNGDNSFVYFFFFTILSLSRDFSRKSTRWRQFVIPWKNHCQRQRQ